MAVDTCLTCGTECTLDYRCECCRAKRAPDVCSCLEGPKLGKRALWRKPRCSRCKLFLGEVKV